MQGKFLEILKHAQDVWWLKGDMWRPVKSPYSLCYVCVYEVVGGDVLRVV